MEGENNILNNILNENNLLNNQQNIIVTDQNICLKELGFSTYINQFYEKNKYLIYFLCVIIIGIIVYYFYIKPQYKASNIKLFSNLDLEKEKEKDKNKNKKESDSENKKESDSEDNNDVYDINENFDNDDNDDNDDINENFDNDDINDIINNYDE